MKTPAFLISFAIAVGVGVPAGMADRVLRSEATEAGELPPVISSDAGPEREIARVLFDMGVLMGRVEQGTLKGADPSTLVPDLVQLRERAAQLRGIIPAAGIDALIEAMESVKESRDLYDQIVEFRKGLALRLAGGIPPATAVGAFDCDQGSWEGVWETSWGDMALIFKEDGQFYGTYGSSQHAVSGKFDPENPKELRGQWHHFGSASPGGIRFEMKAPGRFEGGWSYEIPVKGQGSGWNGTRRRTHHSEILIVPMGDAKVTELDDGRSQRTWSQAFLIKRGFSVHGRPVKFPFVETDTLNPETGEWEAIEGRHYDDFEGDPGRGLLAIGLELPEELAERSIRWRFSRRAIVDDEEQVITLETRPLRMIPPRKKATPVNVLPEEGDSVGEGEADFPSEGESDLPLDETSPP